MERVRTNCRHALHVFMTVSMRAMPEATDGSLESGVLLESPEIDRQYVIMTCFGDVREGRGSEQRGNDSEGLRGGYKTSTHQHYVLSSLKRIHLLTTYIKDTHTKVHYVPTKLCAGTVPTWLPAALDRQADAGEPPRFATAPRARSARHPPRRWNRVQGSWKAAGQKGRSDRR